MKLEQQVVSLELAKRLKELGVEQEGSLEWSIEYRKRDGEASVQLMGGTNDVDVSHNISWRVYDFRKRETYAAFTVAELGEMLPEGYASYVAPHVGKIPPAKWKCIFPMPHPLEKSMYAATEADARGAMLIYLLENGLLKAEGEAA